MAKYSYYNWNNARKTVYVRDGWNQFHTMCAQHRHSIFTDETLDRTFETWDFVSFDTPICRVWHDKKWNVYYVTVNDAYFDCSSSTIHQFSRWISENKFKFTYHDIKRLSMIEKSGTPDISTASLADNIHISYCTNSYFINHAFYW